MNQSEINEIIIFQFWIYQYIQTSPIHKLIYIYNVLNYYKINNSEDKHNKI